MFQELDDLILKIHEKALDLTIRAVGADKYSCATQSNIASAVGGTIIGGSLAVEGYQNSFYLMMGFGALISAGSNVIYKRNMKNIDKQRNIDESNDGVLQHSSYRSVRPLYWTIGAHQLMVTPFSNDLYGLVSSIGVGLFLAAGESVGYFLEQDPDTGMKDVVLQEVKVKF